MVWQDFVKNTFSNLSSDGSEWLLLDLVDERFALTVVGESYVTKSQLAVDGGVLNAECPNIVKRFDGKDYYVESKPLRDYITEFCERILQIYAPDHIVIHRAVASNQYVSQDGRICDFEPAMQAKDKVLNDLLQYMYNVILEQIPDAKQIDCAGKFCASEAHTWGLSSVHYVDDYYRNVMNELDSIFKQEIDHQK